MSLETNPREKLRAAEKFKRSRFWTGVVVPGFEIAELEQFEELLDCPDDEIPVHRANIIAMRAIIDFPDRVIGECKDDIAILETEEAAKEEKKEGQE